MTKHYPGNALVDYVVMSAWDRKNRLKTGDEVIVSSGSQRIRLTITRTTETQFTLDNGSRYSINSGMKIGTADSYNPPTILGIPEHTREEADRRNAAVVAAAQAAAHEADLADILDHIESHAKDGETTVSEVLAALSRLHQTRTR